jgi:CoA-dependent NAD(P)H sulfur oxidoreductase
MGYIGLEMAEAYNARGIEVEMVKHSSRLLPWMPEEMSEVVRQELEIHGVKPRFEASVKSIGNNGSSLTVQYGTGDSTDVDMVLMGVGVKPNSEIAAEAGLELGPGKAVAVDKYMRTSDENIFAAGDCADAFHVITSQRVWIPLALRANRAGWAVADNIMGSNTELPGIVGTAVFKVFDLEISRTGLSVKEAQNAGFDPVENVIKSRTRAHAHPGSKTIHVGLVGDKQTGKLLGATMVGKEGAAHRINSIAVALHAGMTVSEFAQCDMAYAPPFSPVWDPVLTAGNQLLKAMQ